MFWCKRVLVKKNSTSTNMYIIFIKRSVLEYLGSRQTAAGKKIAVTSNIYEGKYINT